MNDESRRAYCASVMARGGGMITTGGHLGVFVSAAENVHRTPIGWTFVDVASATLDDVCEAVELVSSGRKAWPKDVDGRKPQ